MVEIEISTRGNHPALGLIIKTTNTLGNRPQLTEYKHSTPAARIPKWRSMLRNSFPISMNNTPITTAHDIIQAVQCVRNLGNDSVICKFAIVNKIAMHPQMGIPILYHDQLNIIATHVSDIKETMEEQGATHQRYLKAILPSVSILKSTKKKAKLTRRILKVQDDWFQWEAAERKLSLIHI